MRALAPPPAAAAAAAAPSSGISDAHRRSGRPSVGRRGSVACVPPCPRRYLEGDYEHGTGGGQLDGWPPGAEAAASARDGAVESTDEASSVATADAEARARPRLARRGGVRSGRPRPGGVRTGRAHPARRAAPRQATARVLYVHPSNLLYVGAHAVGRCESTSCVGHLPAVCARCLCISVA